MLMSKELLKPLTDLKAFSKSLSVGEGFEKTASLKDSDIAPIVAVIERYYAQTREDKSLDQNPLSGLPGNKSLYDALFTRIEENKPFAVGFIDGNNFTTYNNRYGYERGDSVIRIIGTITNNNDKIYHLGADRYFFISTPDKVQNICEKVIRDYDTQIVFQYDEEAQSRGYIVSTDKQGKSGEFAFMPICIGVATNTKRPLLHPIQVGHIVGEIRKFLRDRQKSDYLIDRRHTDREEEYRGEMAPFSKEELEAAMREIEELKKKEAMAVVKEVQPVRELTGDFVSVSPAEKLSEETASSDQNVSGKHETGNDVKRET